MILDDIQLVFTVLILSAIGLVIAVVIYAWADGKEREMINRRLEPPALKTKRGK